MASGKSKKEAARKEAEKALARQEKRALAAQEQAAVRVPEEERAARGASSGAGVLSAMVERFGGAARVDAVFGPPVEREGVTVIPVARAGFGFGAGGGTNGAQADDQGDGFGGGGGAAVSPAGFIELRAGKARYRPLRDPFRILTTVATGVLAALALRRR